jgi:phosphatidylglycerol phospholipase C
MIPPVVVQPGVEKLDSPVTLASSTLFPAPDFSAALSSKKHLRPMPQIIAHRGYKAKFPENSLLSFSEAVKAGSHALETDIHLTKDDVVVLSHDPTLKRCFGRKEKLIDLEWKEIEPLRSVAAPHVPMPRLIDLLEYLSQPGLEEIWILLDIKLDNDAEDVMRLIGSTINAFPVANGHRPWNRRIVLGIWAAKYLSLSAEFLPTFPVMHIGFKLSYARHFFATPHVGFNMLLPILMAPGGKKFIRECQEKDRRLLAWTVNERKKMEWCIRRRIDGVITDDPGLFLQVRQEFDSEASEPWFAGIGVKGWFDVIRVWIMVNCLFWLYRRRFSPIQKVAEGKGIKAKF